MIQKLIKMKIKTHPDYPKRIDDNTIDYDKKVPFYEGNILKNKNLTWVDNPDISMEELKKEKIWQDNQLVELKDTNIKFDNNNKPITPIKTGIKGRGILGRFGPNHAEILL